jgi:uncharacterized surface protein with fasciclin (FAS1) repeats
MNSKMKLIGLAAILLGVVLLTAIPMTFAQDKDIVDTAVAAGNFTTLAKALQEAGLVETLKGAGPFTVFAPTDEAFKKIPAEKLEAVLKDKEMLKKILLYHVVAGKVMAKDVVGMKSAKTAQGSSIKIASKDGKVMINKANVIKTDIMASNGVIHVIDSVIMPPKPKTKK